MKLVYEASSNILGLFLLLDIKQIQCCIEKVHVYRLKEDDHAVLLEVEIHVMNEHLDFMTQTFHLVINENKGKLHVAIPWQIVFRQNK